jgi:hypothetical protein
MNENLALAEQPARKIRDRTDGKPAVTRHQIGRQAEFADIESAVDQHPLVALKAIAKRGGGAHLLDPKRNPGRRTDGAIIKRHESFVAFYGDGQGIHLRRAAFHP